MSMIYTIRYTNKSRPRSIEYAGKEETTGYYKEPQADGIWLSADGVIGDTVYDKVHHGGENKSCYLYGTENYAYWESRFPALKFEPGMFGENLTVDGLKESEIWIGDIYRIGDAKVQVTQPRQPCYKMGIRFNDDGMPDQFRRSRYPGIYVKVLEAGHVKPGDKMQMLEQGASGLSVAAIFALLYAEQADEEMIQKAIQDSVLPEKMKQYILKKYINKTE
ncbi:MAG: MOSC domain-containing protein [Candidatus Competibacteraceae bacterium]|nr:MOSC domain-containing protein [Candidatus Competibacteraceae bacterium]